MYELENIRQKAIEIADNSLDKIIFGVLASKNNETVTFTVVDNDQSWILDTCDPQIYSRRIERRLQRRERRLKNTAIKNQF